MPESDACASLSLPVSAHRRLRLTVARTRVPPGARLGLKREHAGQAMQLRLPIVLSRLLRDRQRLGYRGQSVRRPTELLVRLRYQGQESRNEDRGPNLPVPRQSFLHLSQALLALPSLSE